MNNDEKPTIARRLYKFDPIIFPNIKFTLSFLAAVIPAAISGKEVPIAINVSPTIDSGMPKNLEILIALSTVKSAPNTVIVIEKMIIGTPKIIGFLTIFFEIISLFISSASELLLLFLI